MVIEYRNANLGVGDCCILHNINMSVDAGDFVYIMGRVGSGKSTLLKSIYGEVDVLDGEAMVLDSDIRRIKASQLPSLRRQLGIVFQSFQLLTDRTVADNLDFVLRATGWKNKSERQNRISEVLGMVGLSGRGDDMPYTMSGGEQQRVCIARALLNSPKLILADEPTGNLDNETATQTISLLYQISRDKGTAVLLSTHNEGLVNQFPGRVLRCQDKTLI